MANPLVRKLQAFAPLSEKDIEILESLPSSVRSVEANQDIIREGDKPDDVHLILDGFACRYKILEDGQRGIVAYLLPGDFCDLHVAILNEMDHSIGALSRCTVADIPRRTIDEITEAYPKLTRALWWATLVDKAILREWLANIGRRSAEGGIAHLLCELLIRLRTIGLVTGNSYALPITQGELADTMGLSHVHVNRVLQKLRADGMIELERGVLTITDIAGMQQLGGFNANYLHLGRKAEAGGDGKEDGRERVRQRAG